jgi:hypothetical protein
MHIAHMLLLPGHKQQGIGNKQELLTEAQVIDACHGNKPAKTVIYPVIHYLYPYITHFVAQPCLLDGERAYVHNQSVGNGAKCPEPYLRVAAVFSGIQHTGYK